MRFFLYQLLFICSFSIFAAPNNLNVKISPREVVLGEKFKLTISFEYDGKHDPYVSFDPRNAELIDDNSNDSSRLMIKGYFAGGKLVQKKIYNFKYEFQPVKKGYSYIQNIKVDLGNKVLRHKSLQIKILSKARRLGTYVLKAEVEKSEAYVGEGINLNYYLYFKGNITQPEVRKFPKLKDFLKRFELPQRGVERVNLQGKMYKRLLIYRAKIYPVKSGLLSVDPVEVAFQYPDMKRGRRDVFGMSMSFTSGSYKTKVLKSKRIKINVLPLPVTGMPSNFTGLVGEHDFSLSFANTKILVNDILEARLEVKGDGALENFDPPEIIRHEGFEQFEAKTEIIEMGNLINKKIIDYTFLARESVKLKSRELKISIFDPQKRIYVQKTIPIPGIQVFGSGSHTEVIQKKETKSDVASDKIVINKLPIIGPMYVEATSDKLFSLEWVNMVLFIILIGIIFSGISFNYSFKDISGLSTIKKKLNYHTYHGFLIQHGGSGDTLRDMIKNSNIPKDTRTYFDDLLDKAEKNEYKGNDIKLVFSKKHFETLVKAKLNENS